MAREFLDFLKTLQLIEREYQLHGTKSYGDNGLVHSILFNGHFYKEMDKSHSLAKNLKSIKSDLETIGLSVEIKEKEVRDPDSYHKTEYCRGYSLEINIE